VQIKRAFWKLPLSEDGTDRVAMFDLIDMLEEVKSGGRGLLEGALDDVVVELSIKFVEDIIGVVRESGWSYITYNEFSEMVEEAVKGRSGGKVVEKRKREEGKEKGESKGEGKEEENKHDDGERKMEDDS